MFRVYLDWNAFSRLDDNDDVYNKTSKYLSNDAIYIIPYSHAHLLDLHRSYLKVDMDGIIGKLNILEKYSNGLLISDNASDELEFLNIHVKNAMEMLIETSNINSSITTNDIFDRLNTIEPLLNIKIENPLLTTSRKVQNGRSKKGTNSDIIISKFLGDSETISIKDILENFVKIASNLHHDNTYNEIRSGYQKDLKVNTGRMRDKRFDPIESLDQIAKKMKFENFTEFHEKIIAKTDKTSLFKKVIELCRSLDFNGYFSDTIKTGHHLDNIETDYQHIGYASTCDIFVSADNNTREKAKLVYRLLNFDIKVFTPREFTDFKENNLAKLENGTEFLDYIFWVAETPPTASTNSFNYYYIPSYVLEYFNLLFQPLNKKGHLILQKYGSLNRVCMFEEEVSSIRTKLLEFYGPPSFEKNKINSYLYTIGWITKNDIIINIKYVDKDLILEIIRN